ncbi:MAG: Fe-S cluster assembly protein SufD [Pseudomonadota bacterium]
MGAAIKFVDRYRAETADLVLNGWEQYITNSDAPDWLKALRVRSGEKVRMSGLPTPKLERFKYINIPAFLKKNSFEFGKTDLSFDGSVEFVSELSKNYDQDFVKEMLEATPVSEDKYGDMMLWDQANSLVAQGVVIDIPKNTTGDKPINLRYKGQDSIASAPRMIARIGENAEITIIELFTSEGASWHNGVSQIQVGKNTRVKHYRLQESSDASLHTQNTHVMMDEGSHYECFTYTTGAKLSRHQVHVDMNGAHAEVHVNGLNLLQEKQNGDTTITVDHRAPHCNSNQDYRTVLADQSQGVFQGKVHVFQPAQKTDGYQFAKSLLLSPTATMHTKPELEIYADDVKCSHGTTSGEIDEQAMFYLRSRGIPEDQAKELLIQAFIDEVIETISSDDMKEHVTHRSKEWLKSKVA